MWMFVKVLCSSWGLLLMFCVYLFVLFFAGVVIVFVSFVGGSVLFSVALDHGV